MSNWISKYTLLVPTIVGYLSSNFAYQVTKHLDIEFLAGLNWTNMAVGMTIAAASTFLMVGALSITNTPRFPAWWLVRGVLTLAVLTQISLHGIWGYAMWGGWHLVRL